MIFESAASALAKALITRLTAGQPGAVRTRQDLAALERAIGAAWRALGEDNRAVLARYDVNPDFFDREGAEEIARVLLPGRGPSGERLALAYARGLGQRETVPSEPLVASFDAFLEYLVEELGRHGAFRTILADVAVTRVAYRPGSRDAGDSPTGSTDRHRGGPRADDSGHMFVVMPFGNRLDHARGRTLDFDSVYHEIIRPAAEQADWTVTRIDDVVEPGVIADQYLRAIVNADLLLADISVPNGNVYYELGIRHAVSGGGTLLIALAGTQIPFDLSAHRVLFYEESGDGRAQLRDRIADALIRFVPRATTNPVRDFLERVGLESSPDIDGVAFERDLSGRVERARNREQLIAVWEWARPFPAVSAAPLQELASRLADVEEWSIAADILATALIARPGDFEIHRQRGWYLQHLGEERDAEAAAAFGVIVRCCG